MNTAKRVVGLVGVALGVLCAPSEASAQSSTESRPRMGLVIAGGVTLGVSYGIAVIAGVNGKQTVDRWSLLPLAGPFVAAATRKDDCKSGRTGFGAFCIEPAPILVIDGVLQVAGATLLGIGLLWRQGVVTIAPVVQPRTGTAMLALVGEL